jgi:hypothetical protein
MEETVRGGHGHKGGALGSAAGLAEDEDASGVAAKFGDVVANPLEGKDKIELASVAAVGEVSSTDIGEVEVAEEIEAMVE